MDKDINRIKAVLAEKGCAARLLSVSWRDTKEPISGWQSNRIVPLLRYQSGVPMTVSQQRRRISILQNCLMWN